MHLCALPHNNACYTPCSYQPVLFYCGTDVRRAEQIMSSDIYVLLFVTGQRFESLRDNENRRMTTVLKHTQSEIKSFYKLNRIKRKIYVERITSSSSSLGTTALHEPWPPVLFASTGLYPELSFSILQSPSLVSPLERHLAIFWSIHFSPGLNFLSHHSLGHSTVLHSFYVTNPAYPSCLHKPNYIFFS